MLSTRNSTRGTCTRSRTYPGPLILRHQGMMAGYDQKSNVVLSDSKERVYSMDEGVEEIPLGLYLVKGDQMCVSLFAFLASPRSMSCIIPSTTTTHSLVRNLLLTAAHVPVC